MLAVDTVTKVSILQYTKTYWEEVFYP